MVNNEQILKDILLKMNYDPSKTLNENKSILRENSIPASEGYYNSDGNLQFCDGKCDRWSAPTSPSYLCPNCIIPAIYLFPKIKFLNGLPKKVSKEDMQKWRESQSPKFKPLFDKEFSERLIKSQDYLSADKMYQAWLDAKNQYPYWNKKYPSPVVNSPIPKEFEDLYRQANPYIKSNYVTYNGSEKPEPPVLYGEYVSSPSYSVYNSNTTYWTLPYETPNNAVRQGNKGKRYLDVIYKKDLEQWKRNQQRERIHIVIPIASIALSLTGPFGIAAGVALELYDAKLYADEGDPLMAGLSIIFALIPAWQLTKLGLKDTAVMAKSTPQTKEFLNKIKNRLPLNAAEQKVKKEILKAQSRLNQQIFINTVRSWVGNFAKLTFEQSLIFLLKLMKYGIIGTKWGIRGVSLLAIAYAAGLEAVDIVGKGSKPSPEEIAEASKLIKDKNGLNQAMVSETIDLLDELEDDTEKQEQAIRASEEYNKTVDDIISKIERGEI